MNFPEDPANLVLDFEPVPLDIPEECRKCPAMEATIDTHVELQYNRAITQAIGDKIVMPGIPEEVRAELVEHLQEEHGSELLHGNINPEDLVSEMETDKRQKLGQLLETMDNNLEAVELAAQLMVATCQRPLTMRATKEGIEHTVTICTSMAPNPNSEVARIKRRPE